MRPLTTALSLALMVGVLYSSSVDAQTLPPGKHLSDDQLAAVVDCITRPGWSGIPKTYSGESALRLRYVYGVRSRELGVEQNTIVLLIDKRNRDPGRLYELTMEPLGDRVEVFLLQITDFYKEDGRWRSKVPFNGGLGTMRTLEQLGAEMADRKLVLFPVSKIKRSKTVCFARGASASGD
jgi:hypothetical protein